MTFEVVVLTNFPCFIRHLRAGLFRPFFFASGFCPLYLFPSTQPRLVESPENNRRVRCPVISYALIRAPPVPERLSLTKPVTRLPWPSRNSINTFRKMAG